MNRNLLLWLLLMPGALLAQSRQVRGTVRTARDKTSLPGSVVTLKGTATGTTTSAVGSFTLTVPNRSVTLVVTAVGYRTREITVAPTTDTVAIALAEDARTLSEVVVTGYRTESRKSVTGSPAAGSPTAGSVAVIAGSPAVRGPADGWSTPAASRATPGRTQPGNDPTAKPGMLTAGEIHDFSKWTLWQDVARKDLAEWKTLWNVQPLNRYTVQLLTADGFPVVDAVVSLNDKQQHTVWSTRSDNTGKGELWASPFDSTATPKEWHIEARVDEKTYEVRKPVLFGRGTNTITVREPCQSGGAVDVAFVVDATGSMGDEIRFLQAELSDVLHTVKKQLAGTTLRSGSVFYRDINDEYLTRTSDFTTVIDSTARFVNQQAAGGGGDYPEAVDQALNVALAKLSWSATAKARLLFLVLDAPPHNTPAVLASLHETMQQAAAQGIRIIPIAASGINKSTEYLLRSMALTTNGTYVFLTDDSGIGDTHIKPTTDQYTVERLNALLVRLVLKFTQTPECQPVPVSAVATTTGTDGPPVSTSVIAEDGSPADGAAFTLYPNPVHDVLHVESQVPITEAFVLDVTGKIVLRSTPGDRRFALALSAYPTGVYFLRVQMGKEWQTRRFVLNR